MKAPRGLELLCLAMACQGAAACSDASEPPPGHQIGVGDGSAASVRFTEIFRDEAGRLATDLAFHPQRDELWVVLREPNYDPDAPCTETETAGCAALEGSTEIIHSPGAMRPTAEWKQDQNAWHFMRRPTSIAFGAKDTFATCHEARTGNFTDSAIDFIGPTLWSSDPAIYAVAPSPGGNGSHIDMLHSTPFCMGIAHERDNVYWTFNGQIGAIDRYDFHEPHIPGAEDHMDGELSRWVTGAVLRVVDVPSHMAFDRRDGSLYVVDTGNGRIVRLDSKSGSPGAAFPNPDAIAISNYVDGAVLTEVVPPGQLQAPSGLALVGDVLLVTDNATSVIHAFGLDGQHLRELRTELPAGTLAGIAVGRDDRAYFVDFPGGRVVRIDI